MTRKYEYSAEVLNSIIQLNLRLEQYAIVTAVLTSRYVAPAKHGVERSLSCICVRVDVVVLTRAWGLGEILTEATIF